MNAHTPIDERHAIGANNPPEPTPFEAIEVHIKDLYVEAQNWCDGEPISTDGQAEKVDQLLDMVKEAEKTADAERVKENEPFDRGKAAVQARYAPLISDTKSVKGLTVKARAACLAVLAPWRQKKEDERVAAAEAARQEALAKAAAAAAAIKESDPTNLAQQERAEELVFDALQATKDADRAARDVTKGSGLRSVWKPVMVDRKAALIHYASRRAAELEAFLQDEAEKDVRAGIRSIPGFDITKERVAR